MVFGALINISQIKSFTNLAFCYNGHCKSIFYLLRSVTTQCQIRKRKLVL